jgi:hypothetical protein
MLSGLKRRRFARSHGAGRVDGRWFGAGGVLREQASVAIHRHRHMITNRTSLQPVFRIAISRPTALAPGRNRDRIETRVMHQSGPVRELLQFESLPARAAARNDSATLSTRSLRELTETTVERVIRRRQRIETGRDTSVVMRERQNIIAGLDRVLEHASARSPGVTPGVQAASPVQSGASPIPNLPDLDRLTDQIVSRIDDRLIAHRERMGTSF